MVQEVAGCGGYDTIPVSVVVPEVAK